ncbi:MAG: hypothetical protein CM1200mP39_04400 [Dehalococcoidia bacterium]|nr:MAG: hypothetical protein CM1200mP39_04400 [Dehalococcoidia bacterium]
MQRGFAAGYKQSREWVNTADPGDCQGRGDFFPDMAESAIASAVGFYQSLGTWSGGLL